MQLDVAALARSPVPPSVLAEAPTLVAALRALVESWPDYPALIFLDGRGREQRVTYAQLWKRARELEGVFLAAGLRPGGVTLLALPTSLELAAAYVGAQLARGIPALVTTPFHRFASRRVYSGLLGSILRVARAEILYCVEEVADVCRDNPSLAIGETRVVVAGATAGASGAGSVATPGSDDVAMIQYTSGSTGDAKGVVLTHRAILNNMRSTGRGLGLGAEDVSVNWAPLYHDMGLIDTYLRPMLTGSPTVLIPTAVFLRHPPLWLWAIHSYRATVSWAPNFAYALCANRVSGADLAGLDLSSWRVAVNASEPCVPETMRAFARRYAPYGYAPEAMTPAWGCAEAVCIATAHPVAEQPRTEVIDRRAIATEGVARPAASDGLELASIGKCLPDGQVEIRDADGRALEERRVGRIWLRTRSLAEGYQGDPALTARVFVGGWIDTGDRGYVADGYLFFVAREKDLIVLGGEKYSPQDLENAIDRVSGVREGCSVAFGVLNEERGTEDVAAVVETREESESALAALREAIRAEVVRATGLALRYVVLVPPGGIQKTTSGKLARSATKERYADRLTLA